MKEKAQQFYYLLDNTAKKGIPFLIAAYFFSSLLDVVGIGSVGVFLGLLANPSFFAQKFPHAHFLFGPGSEKQIIVICGLLVITTFIFKAILALFIQTKVVSFCKAFSVRLKTRMMTAYQYAPYTYHLQKNSAYLLSRIQGSIDAYVNMLLSGLNFACNFLIAMAVLFFLAILHPFITIFLAFMFLLLIFGYDFFAKRKVTALATIAAESVGEMIKFIHHGLHGLVEIRVLNKEEFFIQALTRVSQQYARAMGVLLAFQQAPRYLVESTIAIFMVVLSIGGIIAGYQAAAIVTIVGIFGAAGARLLPIFNQIMATFHDVRSYYPHMCFLHDDLKELEALSINNRQSPIEKLNFNTVTLADISYQYPQTDRLALEKINITFTKGQSLGLIGASGAGKSTLVNLILGFLSPQQGKFLIDQQAVDNLKIWLNNFAYIPQTIFLLDDTLKRNIALGVLDEDIDEVKIWNAIKMAQLTEVVQQLPQGMDTLLGENGVRLSGGQRQRVALARAFYHERDIIVMDEATSSLDNETEKEIINTIKRLKGSKTLIVIAHRLSTVEHCDVLYKLDKGRITSVGTFQEVIGAVIS